MQYSTKITTQDKIDFIKNVQEESGKTGFEYDIAFRKGVIDEEAYNKAMQTLERDGLRPRNAEDDALSNRIQGMEDFASDKYKRAF